jgi:hypothetical protein
MTALNYLNACPLEVKVADEAAWSQLVYRLKSARAEERLIALEKASDLLRAAIVRGELDGESARQWMIALLTAVAAHWRWDPPSFRFTLRLRLLKGVFDAFQVCKPSVFRPISYLEKRAACRTSFAPAGTKRDLCRSRTRHQGFRTLLVVRELL